MKQTLYNILGENKNTFCLQYPVKGCSSQFRDVSMIMGHDLRAYVERLCARCRVAAAGEGVGMAAPF